MSSKISPAWPEILASLAAKIEVKLQQAVKQYGAPMALRFHDKYGSPSPPLPLNQAINGIEAKTLHDLSCLLSRNRGLATLPSFLQAGLALYLLQEVDLALDFLSGQEPPADERLQYHGPVAEQWLREFGIGLLARKYAGVALLTAPATTQATKLVQGLHSRGLLLFLSGEELVRRAKQGVEGWGYEFGIIPLGPELRSLTYALGFAATFALQFGKVAPGDLPQLRDYLRSNFHGLALFLGASDEAIELAMAGALALGLAVVTEEKPSWAEHAPKGRFLPLSPDQIPEEGESERAEIFLEKCLEHARIKPIYPPEPVLPVEYRTELEGEAVVDEDLAVELRGFELVTSKDLAQVRDGRLTVVGPGLLELGREAPLGLLVEVAGRQMKKEFEPVLERQILHLLASAEGVEHQGSRDRTVIRLSKRAVEKGLRLEHLAHILHIGLHSQFESVLDKVQVTIYTEGDEVRELLEQARQIYQERDARVAGLRDETVDTFYSCLSCQSLTPYHLCIVTPERPGMCGAVNYLDCQASYEINPEGQNHPIAKEGLIDPIKGEWESINQYVQEHAQKKFDRFCLNSILDDPPSISSLCECLTTLIPEANGVLVIDREDPSPTPLGMTFAELLSLGVGAQTPGLIGHARAYLTSGKFLAAEGGIKRVVWMSRRLKEKLEEDLREAGRRVGVPDLPDKIGDGETTPTVEDLLTFLREKKHPALDMPPIM